MLEIGISQRRRALLHVLIGSKTGISAPSPKFVAVSGALQATSTSSPTPVSGAPPAKPWASGCAPAGWRKFPAPSSLPDRHSAARSLFPQKCASGARPRLACGRAPNIARASFWARAWRDAFDPSLDAGASFGPLMRGRVRSSRPRCFAKPRSKWRGPRSAALRRSARTSFTCPHLAELKPPHFVENQASRRDFELFRRKLDHLFRRSIDDGGDPAPPHGAESEKLFRWLNADLENRFPISIRCRGAGAPAVPSRPARPSHPRRR